MLATQKPRRTREYAGPTPHSVAIRAKMPSKLPPDHLILERRRHDDAREEAEAVTKYNALCDLKNDWERITDRRIQLNTVSRKVKGLMLEQEFTLEDRRERLRQLLAAEDAQYLEEMEASQETMLERQAKMRERAKFLKEKREKERLQVVAEKLDQRWREECEELRSTLTRRHMDEVCLERGEQLRIKADMDQQSQAEEKMYADLWHQDMLAKAAREEREAQERHARNQETLKTLQKQKAALEAKKQDAKRLKEEEGRLLAEERELRKMEEQRAQQEKLAKQQQAREDIATNIRLKTKRRAKEMQEELALDMNILEKLLSDSRNEAMEIAQRKKELREEDQRYREYLRQTAREDEERDREIDKLVDAEVQRQWQKRLDEWARQREARKRLMDNVLAVRRQQVEAKLAENAKAQIELQKERELMQAAMDEHKRLEEEKLAGIRRENLAYQDDLLGQLDYTRRQHEMDKDEEHREYLKGLEAEAEYQAKLKEALARPVIDKMHPMRRAHMAKRASGVPYEDLM
ncbi:cilia- and flagella-associated protein 53-like [Patiria miniata]|uniref:Cilia- and flagella-associated protein 53 n=1 Tax=Patiria miniata TaxID=46514 RepID=A0A914BPS9_PATMI|nr:cilia- and flagella-associated protein 53-like [Patiria miniata]